MHPPPLLLVAALLAAPARPEHPPPAENLLAGPVRCVLRHLDAVRLAGSRAAAPRQASPGAPRRVLESFQLLAARWAARGGTAIVTVSERFSRPAGPRLEAAVAEYLVALVGGEWKIVQRREAG